MVLEAVEYALADWDPDPLLKWHARHTEIPIFVCSLYLYFLTYGPKWVTTAWNVKGFLVVWNICLALFSVIGIRFIGPILINKIRTEGIHATVCNQPDWYIGGVSGFFIAAFIYSKFFELMDTAFLIIRKKEVIFLHWFHHVTVLLYCWHSYHHNISSGIWFAAMNYLVHSLMYTYYALAIYGFKPVFKLSPLITTIQILQMLGGISIQLHVGYVQLVLGEPCHVEPSNWKLGLAMYASYFVLFSVLFFQKYISKDQKSPVDNPCFVEPKTVASVGDFRTDEEFDTEKKTN